MTPEERRSYNAMKQREYRRKRGLKREPYLSTEQILGSEGHCKSCGMRLDAQFHQKFPCRDKAFTKYLDSDRLKP